MAALNWNVLTALFPFGVNPMNLEGILFGMASKFSEDYNGGSWKAVKVGDFTIPMAPEGEYNVVSSDNYYSGKMDAMTYGAALSLYMFNHCLWSVCGVASPARIQELTEMFYALRDAVYEDKRFNTAEIAAFLD